MGPMDQDVIAIDEGRERAAIKEANNEQAPAGVLERRIEACPPHDDGRLSREERVRNLLSSTIDKMEAAINAQGFKATIVDYMKLVQMEQEMEKQGEDIKEIRVTWVEPTESEIGE